MERVVEADPLRQHIKLDGRVFGITERDGVEGDEGVFLLVQLVIGECTG